MLKEQEIAPRGYRTHVIMKSRSTVGEGQMEENGCG